MAIEIIGDVHGYKSRERSDALRQRRIESLGIKILTFTNGQVQQEMDGVLNDILSNLPPAPSFVARPVAATKGSSVNFLNKIY